MAARARRPTAPACRSLLLLALLLLCGEGWAKKKSPAKRVGFLKTAAGRDKYVRWVYDKYDDDGNSKLTESEVDTANDEEPPVMVSKGYEDYLELFDIDLLDKDPVDGKVTRAELLAKLEELEERRLAAIEGWKGKAELEKDMLAEFDARHTVSDTAVNAIVKSQRVRRPPPAPPAPLPA